MEKIQLNLRGITSSSWEIIGTFQKLARRNNWPENEINKVLQEANSGSYDHLVETIKEHCK